MILSVRHHTYYNNNITDNITDKRGSRHWILKHGCGNAHIHLAGAGVVSSLSGQGQGQEGCWVQSVDINYLFSWETETVCVSVLMKKSKTIVSNLHFYHPIYVLETV